MTTKKAPSLLHPGPWLSGALLLVATGAAFQLIHFIAQTASFAGVHSPRLVALVVLAMIASPIVLVAGAHHATQKVLDRLAGEKASPGAWPGLTSWWAGMFAWLVSTLVSCGLLMAGGLVDSGHVVESVTRIFARTSVLDLVNWPALLWIAVAGCLYAFERQAKHAFGMTKASAVVAPWKFYAGSLVRAAVLTTFLAELAVAAILLGIGAAVAAQRESHSIAILFVVLTMISPIILVALGDHGVRHLMSVVGWHRAEKLGAWPSVKSWWTGLYSWFVLAFGGLATFAVHALLFGDAARVDPRSTLQPFGSTTLVFIAIAAVLFHVEASVRRRFATGAE